jgi:alkaline phosphatase D
MSHTPLTRRRFITGAAAGAGAVILAPQSYALGLANAKPAPLFRGGHFADGVMSGDPSANGVTLWTRLDGVEGAGRVELEIATDKLFRKTIQKTQIATSAAVNHSVKARVAKLKPYEEYYYRFSTKTGDSRVGRFRTAPPAGSKQSVNFAFFSCQDYTHGYYNAHELMAKGDYDFVVCLGDYIYAESYHSPVTTAPASQGKQEKTGVREDAIGKSGPNPSIVREALTLQNYRDKYSLYRSDKSLQAVHAKFPMVMLWDDHEVQDNYAGKEADGGLPPVKRFSAARKKAADRAFFESMPAFAGANQERLYRSLNFGNTVELIVMDQRAYRANQPCGDAVAPACADWDQPRDFLGRKQMNWLKTRLSSSKAAWKILANEVTIMPTKVLGDSYYTFDSWQGYPREREELLAHVKDKGIADVVFITGDIHTFITGDVRRDMGKGETVALEFVGGSISSQSLGETDLDAGSGVTIKGNDSNPNTPTAIIDTLRTVNPWVDQADFDHHGFGQITADAKGLRCEMVRLETIKTKSLTTLPSATYTYDVKRGQKSIKGVHGPA